MKKNNKPIFITALIAVLAVITIAGILYYKQSKDTSGMDKDNPGAIDITGYTNSGDVIIRSASYIYTDDGKIDGYLVTVSSKGYKDNILMDITFDNTGDLVKSVAVKDQKESKGYGDGITDEAFLSQFNDIPAPVSLSANNASQSGKEEEASGTEPETSDTNATDADSADTLTPGGETTEDTASSDMTWSDGTYETEETEFDEQGYKDKVSITIQDGKITEVIWDAYNAQGQLKSVLSADGAYEMTDRGPTWQEQAVAIADFVIQNQSPDGLTTNAEGKTDAVSGVSISVRDFITLIKECLVKAAATEPVTETAENDLPSTPADTGDDTPDDSESSGQAGQIDAVSGATVSSAAVVNGVNKAQAFIKDFVLNK